MSLTTVQPAMLTGTGKVVQVVNATYSTQVSNSTTTYADTGLTASITPLFSTSKILVFVNMNDCWSSASGRAIALQVVRNSTPIIVFANEASYNTSTGISTSAGTTYLDSPATTSATTYKVQFRNSQTNAQVNINDSNVANSSTIILMEIAQ